MTMSAKTKKVLTYVGVGVAGAVIGGIIVAKHVNNKEQKLEELIDKARSTLNSINYEKNDVMKQLKTEVEKAVQSVYTNEAMDAFQKKFDEADIEKDIYNLTKVTVEDTIEDAVESALKDYDFDDIAKDYIEKNSSYFDHKICKELVNILDKKDMKELVKEVIMEEI